MPLTLTGILLVFVSWVMIPATSVAAVVLAWLAFRRRTPHYRLFWIAIALLALPYALAVVIEREEGLEFLVSPDSPYLLTALVGTVITIVGVRRYRQLREEESNRIRAEVRQELRERYDRNRMQIKASDRPVDPSCPQCGATLIYFDSEISSGAFRPQAASMPQMPIHYYDCNACNTCWKLGTKLLPDPIRQILKG